MNSAALDFALVIPFYNYEAKAIETLTRVKEWREKNRISCQVVCVDDCSKDGTPALLDRFMAAHSEWCRLVRLPENHGKGGAVRAGFKVAKDLSEIVVFTDCDLHYGLNVINERVVPLLDQNDVVILERSWVASAKHQSWTRRLASDIFNRAAIVFTGVFYRDTQAGLKGFRSASCAALFDALRIERFAFDVEVLSLAIFYRYRIAQVPIQFADGYAFPQSSTVNLFRTWLPMCIEVLKINLNWKLKRYHKRALLDRIDQAIYTIH